MKKITVYTKSGCPQCDMTKRVLTENEVEFELVDVEKDEKAFHYIKEELGLSAMPVVIVEGEEPFTGFRPDKLNELVD
ncbi:thioredoxin domain [Bacillus phage vB_BanS_Sophrita]|uniref:Glutaredoxin n=2 Tax=Sophritavirus TaxID=3044834 RepID=A0A3Q9R7H6_9CAUD|nr:thioredoxin domain [Bacillus phage vB_BanS_Sophrita]YP_010679979.1 thioredoxin domain [Bacillus phage pW2]AZU98866.1 glutaredoxin [Bacillus phage pW2]UGO50733.1 glutaredoxin [Bacillus phage vB_BanS_Sophrita]